MKKITNRQFLKKVKNGLYVKATDSGKFELMTFDDLIETFESFKDARLAVTAFIRFCGGRRAMLTGGRHPLAAPNPE